MIDEEALGWVIRTRDPAFSDWEGFTAWLEGAPERAAAYDALMADDAELPALIPAEPVGIPAPANDPGVPTRKGWRWMGGGAVAAALVGVISIGLMNRTDIYSVTTQPGESRVIALDDGTRVEMNGGTTMHFDRKNPRFAALDTGEAAFTVKHDAADPFRVNVGDQVFEDAGTVFNIVRTAQATRIGVSEGKVVYNPSSDAIALTPGHALSYDGARVQLMDVAPEAVASWRHGNLTYANAAVGDISQDISRSLGIKLIMSPEVRSMRFTGTIKLDRDPQRFFSGTAPLMGLSAVRQGDGWLLKEEDGPSG